MEWIIENWDTIVAVSGGVLAIATAVTKATASPKDDEIVKSIVNFFSMLQHRDVGGVKLPLTPGKKADRE